MATDRRKQIVLGSLLLLLAFALYTAFAAMKTSPAGPVASNRSRTAARGTPGQAPVAPDVHLEALANERPAPADAERNLFRFKATSAAPRPSTGPGATTTPGLAPPPPPPSGPPPLPPIPLKFIGLMEQPGTKAKIAVLSDGQGPPMFGTEGGTVAGRFRVLRIGVESIELSYLDGRGRQTIRLTGG